MQDSSSFEEITTREISAALTHSRDSDPEVLADLILTRIKARFGGSTVYIPANDNGQRNQAIREKFNGRNHAEVCERFRISIRTLYRVLNHG